MSLVVDWWLDNTKHLMISSWAMEKYYIHFTHFLTFHKSNNQLIDQKNYQQFNW